MTLNKAGNMDIGTQVKKGHINTKTQRHKQKQKTQGTKAQEIKDTKGQGQLKKIIR